MCLGENDKRNVETVSEDSRLTVSLRSPIKRSSAKQLRTMRSQSSEQVYEDYAESQARVIRQLKGQHLQHDCDRVKALRTASEQLPRLGIGQVTVGALVLLCWVAMCGEWSSTRRLVHL